jgi:hypothetical protein
VCSVRSGREALTRRANTKKKTRRRWKRCWTKHSGKERERKVGERERNGIRHEDAFSR